MFSVSAILNYILDLANQCLDFLKSNFSKNPAWKISTNKYNRAIILLKMIWVQKIWTYCSVSKNILQKWFGTKFILSQLANAVFGLCKIPDISRLIFLTFHCSLFLRSQLFSERACVAQLKIMGNTKKPDLFPESGFFSGFFQCFNAKYHADSGKLNFIKMRWEM